MSCAAHSRLGFPAFASRDPGTAGLRVEVGPRPAMIWQPIYSKDFIRHAHSALFIFTALFTWIRPEHAEGVLKADYKS
jgi:hypothetical protein